MDHAEGWGVHVVLAMFPKASRVNIPKYFHVIDVAFDRELDHHGISNAEDRLKLKLYAYATIRVENSRFDPRDEHISRYNTVFHSQKPQNAPANLVQLYEVSEALIKSYHLDRPFALYDDSLRGKKHALGNTKDGMGERYKGRGFIQITGRSNYATYARLAHAPQIVDHPEKAGEPAIAARILAAYILHHNHAILSALGRSDFRAARAVVNGHLALHYQELEKSYKKGLQAMSKNHQGVRP